MFEREMIIHVLNHAATVIGFFSPQHGPVKVKERKTSVLYSRTRMGSDTKPKFKEQDVTLFFLVKAIAHVRGKKW
jgi:hypothetical protein